MKFKVKLDHLNRKIKKLKPYTTFVEKNYLISENDELTYEELLRIFSDVKATNEIEAAVLLCKLREISVSDLLEFTQECPECHFMNPFECEISEIVNLQTPEYGDEERPDEDVIPFGVFTSVDEIINTKTADSLLIKEYDQLQKKIVEQSHRIFQPVITRKCRKCSAEIKTAVDPRNIMSKSSHHSIFREYLELSYYTNNSKKDVDSMYPYEREIFLNLLKDKLQKDIEAKAGQNLGI